MIASEHNIGFWCGVLFGAGVVLIYALSNWWWLVGVLLCALSPLPQLARREQS